MDTTQSTNWPNGMPMIPEFSTAGTVDASNTEFEDAKKAVTSVVKNAADSNLNSREDEPPPLIDHRGNMIILQ